MPRYIVQQPAYVLIGIDAETPADLTEKIRAWKSRHRQCRFGHEGQCVLLPLEPLVTNQAMRAVPLPRTTAMMATVEMIRPAVPDGKTAAVGS